MGMEFVAASLAFDLGPQTDTPTKAVTDRSVGLYRGMLDHGDDKLHQDAASSSTKSSPSCGKTAYLTSLGCREIRAKEAGTISMFTKP